ncbi:hypothetical protein [Petropleomorpha daqingensis]|uniref:Uncharacterized protein n=1 Tax=Petropleomorpha daqingensis TaxID=2026353 RepID=A0A853CER8_9ACTN|nr:hypothetical protein [Petropleomorpha daqingensis]NYJ06495.1 hypothetical protein [Petropleomorpha daqingensis]
MIIAFVVLLAVLAVLALGTLVRWLATGTDGRPRPVDPTHVKFPELYGSARMGLR